jgi:hypothetical protein
MAAMHHPTARPVQLVLVVAIATVLAACATTSTPTTTPAPPTDSPAPSAPAPTTTPIPAATILATAAPTPPGQLATDWEQIWGDLPSSFPSYPASHPTETGQGPASATLDAGAASPAEVVAWYQTALGARGYAPVSRAGPREDRSYELIMGGQGGCRVRITAVPLGATTIITVMYGVGCPFA